MMKQFQLLKMTGIILIWILSGIKVTSAQNVLLPYVPSADSLVSDFKQLATYLEQTHPDPYSSFGGRVFFNIEVNSILKQLSSRPYTLTEFAALANEFLAHLKDGHTSLSSPSERSRSSLPSPQNKPMFEIPAQFRAIPDGMILSGIPERQAHLLGNKLLSVNGISLDSLTKRIARIKPCENQYGAYRFLSSPVLVKQLMSGIFPNADTLIFEFENDRKERNTLSFFRKGEHSSQEKIRSIPATYPAGLANSYLGYGFADTEKKIMLFSVKQILARENFEYVLKNKQSGWIAQLEYYYRLVGKEMPRKKNNNISVADTTAAIAGVPSFSTVFHQLLIQMKAHGSNTLIIDLRSNDGGWTSITLPTLYMMYGDRYLKTDLGNNFYKRISPLLLQKENRTLQDYRNRYNRQIESGDFIFPDSDENEIPLNERRESFINYALCCIPEKLPRKGTPIYTPENIYVITDPGTFSAAFHYAFYLWKMGAKIVGTPCAQAPNTYMETTPFTLPYTGLKGSISNAMQVFLPANDPRSKIFFPDIMLKYSDYQYYDFDANAELLYLIDLLQNKR